MRQRAQQEREQHAAMARMGMPVGAGSPILIPG